MKILVALLRFAAALPVIAVVEALDWLSEKLEQLAVRIVGPRS